MDLLLILHQITMYSDKVKLVAGLNDSPLPHPPPLLPLLLDEQTEE